MKLVINGYKVHTFDTALIIFLILVSIQNIFATEWRELLVSLGFLSFAIQLAVEESKSFNLQKKVDSLEALPDNVQEA